MFKLTLKRIFKGNTYTIGKLYDPSGKWICDTLEDIDRSLTSKTDLSEIKKKKVYGKTAIPLGSYKIDMNTVSPRFADRSWAKPYSGKLPRLQNVPGFDGVLIHVGNSDADTSGCVLVGENKVKGRLVNSTASFNKLMGILKNKKDIILEVS